jgi:hypothetical protein
LQFAAFVDSRRARQRPAAAPSRQTATQGTSEKKKSAITTCKEAKKRRTLFTDSQPTIAVSGHRFLISPVVSLFAGEHAWRIRMQELGRNCPNTGKKT